MRGTVKIGSRRSDIAMLTMRNSIVLPIDFVLKAMAPMKQFPMSATSIITPYAKVLAIRIPRAG